MSSRILEPAIKISALLRFYNCDITINEVSWIECQTQIHESATGPDRNPGCGIINTQAKKNGAANALKRYNTAKNGEN